jgi:hypothetical protein
MMLLLVALAISATAFAGVGAAAAEVNTVTPSTNGINKASGSAYVDVTPGPGTASLAFTTPNAWYSCFEYRTDGDTTQKTSDTNHNTLVGDGLYPYVCVNGANPTKSVTVNADEYVEVRMVFGAEADERFDWTRFDVDPACAFTTKNATMTLNADCTTSTTIKVPNGYTLDGKGRTITAVDPSGAAFNGAVVQNDGATMNVKNLTIDGASNPAAEDCNRVFHGVAFMAASGSITGVTLTHIGLPATGCQIGRAILVDAIGSATRQSVKVEGNMVSNYNKNGIDVRGNIDAKIVGNTVEGSLSDLIARNGIVVRTGASAQVWSNTVSGNNHPAKLYGAEAYGILVIDATVNMTKQNTVINNQNAFLNEGGSVVGKKTSA